MLLHDQSLWLWSWSIPQYFLCSSLEFKSISSTKYFKTLYLDQQNSFESLYTLLFSLSTIYRKCVRVRTLLCQAKTHPQLVAWLENHIFIKFLSGHIRLKKIRKHYQQLILIQIPVLPLRSNVQNLQHNVHLPPSFFSFNADWAIIYLVRNQNTVMHSLSMLFQ